MKLDKYFNEIIKVAFKKPTDIRYTEINGTVVIAIDSTLTMCIPKESFLFDIDKLKNKLNINYFIEEELAVDEDELVNYKITNKVILYQAIEYIIFKSEEKADDVVLVERKKLKYFDVDCYFKANKQKTKFYIFEDYGISGYLQTLNSMLEAGELKYILQR